MIQLSFKNYFGCLKYYFTPLGILFLFTLLGILQLGTGIKECVEAVSNGISQISGEASGDIAEFKEALLTNFQELFTYGSDVTFLDLFEEDGIKKGFEESLEIAVGSVNAYNEIMRDALKFGLERLFLGTLSLLLCFIMGIVVGIYFTKWLIRKQVAKRTWIETLKSFLIGSPILILELALAILLVRYLSQVWYLVLILILLIFAFGSLSKAYIIQRKKGMKFKDVVNMKNMLKLYCADIVIYLLGFGFAALSFVIFQSILNVVIAVPFIMISFVLVSLTSESFIYEEFKKK